MAFAPSEAGPGAEAGPPRGRGSGRASTARPETETPRVRYGSVGSRLEVTLVSTCLAIFATGAPIARTRKGRRPGISAPEGRVEPREKEGRHTGLNPAAACRRGGRALSRGCTVTRVKAYGVLGEAIASRVGLAICRTWSSGGAVGSEGARPAPPRARASGATTVGPAARAARAGGVTCIMSSSTREGTCHGPNEGAL